MKNLTLKITMTALLIGLPLSLTSAFADNEDAYTRVAINISEVFAPVGFDDNDEVTVMLDGMMPDTCYKVADTEIEFNREKGTYNVTQYAKRFDNAICLSMRIPFSVELNLGTLPKGQFEIKSEGDLLETLEVEESTNAGPDDHLYFPVDSVNIVESETGDHLNAVIKGRFTNTCMQLGEVKIIDTGKTKQILPLITMADRTDCIDDDMPVSWMIELPDAEPGRYLVHTRSLNGKAINTMYTRY
jgi:hypothetical protein